MNDPRGKLRIPRTRQCQYYHDPVLYYHLSSATLTNISTRCENVPTAFLKQRTPGPDGRRGTIAVCDRCRKILELIVEPHFFLVNPINLDTQEKAELKNDRRRRGLTRAEASAEARGIPQRPPTDENGLITRDRDQTAPKKPRPKWVKFDHDLVINRYLKEREDPFFEEDDPY